MNARATIRGGQGHKIPHWDGGIERVNSDIYFPDGDEDTEVNRRDDEGDSGASSTSNHETL